MPAPVGLRLLPDPGTRLVAGGLVLVGGSPVRVLRLTPAGARQVAGWFSGTPLPAAEAPRRLARRLLDAGLAHPDHHSPSAPPGGTTPPNPPEKNPVYRTVPADSPPPTAPRGDPTVTVVIPVRDRHRELARCLAALRGASDRSARPATATAHARPSTVIAPDAAPDPTVLTRSAGSSAPGRPPAVGPDAVTPPVIVVDDASADPAAIAAIAAAYGARVIHRPVNGGPGAARNTGLAAASTDLVAFLDSDCVPPPGWLDTLLPHFADPAVGAVAPRIVPHETGDSWLARYEGASSTLDMGGRPSIVRPGARVSYVPGAALVVRRAAAGAGFAGDMVVGEDVDFVWRLAAAGWRARYEPAATMGHDHRVRFRPWFARRADYGTSAAALEERHPGAVRPLYASWWTVGAWAAALSGRPVTAAALTAAATALLARRLSSVTAEPWPFPTSLLAESGDNSKKLPSADAAPDIGGSYRQIATASTPDLPVGPQKRDNSKKRAAEDGRTIWRGEAWRLAARLAGGGTLAAGRPIGSALSRTWWPVAVPAAIAFPGLRRPVAALIVVPPLLDWADRRPPLDPARYVAARLLDDVAYSLGVWHGCLRRRTIRPLLPVIGSKRPPNT